MKHYVRIHYQVPELGGELLNIAELQLIDAHSAHMLRMIELDPDETITGIYVDGRVHGQANQPLDVVPHPSVYSTLEGITATELTPIQFEALWQEAAAKFPH